MITIIYGHPYDGSFNHAILDTVTARLTEKKMAYTTLDLYADNFDPAVRVQDLALYSKGRTTDSLANKYLEILKKTEELIFIYPVWWGIEPAIIKGFYDKVLLKDATWEYSPDCQLLPLLNIKKTVIFTTSEAPSAIFAPYFEKYLPEHVFNSVGMKNLSWHNMERITTASLKERNSFLRLVEDSV